ncbi:MAG: GIY-YIG nuclease family protein [Spirochaetes bacterium]|nr:GIY-YIG nuclease family protein [Spirochaetota bacterium]
MEVWFIYIVKCSDKTLYTGITKNIEKRINEHNNKKGAKYTKPRTPVALIYKEKCNSRSDAAKRENEIKRMQRKQKLSLIRL